jgi:hypothetical protein
MAQVCFDCGSLSSPENNAQHPQQNSANPGCPELCAIDRHCRAMLEECDLHILESQPGVPAAGSRDSMTTQEEPSSVLPPCPAGVRVWVPRQRPSVSLRIGNILSSLQSPSQACMSSWDGAPQCVVTCAIRGHSTLISTWEVPMVPLPSPPSAWL